MPSFFLTVAALLLVVGVSMTVAHWLRHRSMLRAPRITAVELDALEARLAAAGLPCLWVTLLPAARGSATASGVGGAPYIDSMRYKWPVRGENKQPMLFLAQINFAETPPIEDFPRKGLFQIFVLADDRGQIQATERKTDRVIRWFPEPEGDLTLTPPAALTPIRKPGTFSKRVIRDGLGMAFEVNEMAANPYNWPYIDQLPNENERLPENDSLKDRLDKFFKESEISGDQLEGKNWIGGHPRFVQQDVRSEPRLRKLNRVLLHLTSTHDDINFGDGGELNLMISRKDLRQANFDEAFCTWDCS